MTTRQVLTTMSLPLTPMEEDDSSDVILAFINSDEDDVDDRRNATRSVRIITRRSEIDLCFLINSSLV